VAKVRTDTGLLRNCFHLVIEMPAPDLVAGMKWLLGT
jgi:hypothetical protein